MHGFSGTGKSVIAKKLSETTHFTLFQSDVIRKEIAGLYKVNRDYTAYDRGIYTKDFSDKTYETMLEYASAKLKKNQTVILDATFGRKKYRDSAIQKAKSFNLPLFIINCRLPENLIKERLIKRELENKDISDATWEIYLKQKENFEDLSKEEENLSVNLNVENDLTLNVKIILSKISEIMN